VRQGGAQWDERQEFVKKIHKWNEAADRLRTSINNSDHLNAYKQAEMRKQYFEYLRTIYMNVRPILDKKDQKELDDMKDDLKDSIKAMRAASRRQLYKPKGLEDDLENFHQKLNQARFDKNLIIPTSMEPTSAEDLVG